MRLDVDPFGDYDLRMALKLSIKRKELIDKILLGHGAIGNDHPISPVMAYYAADLPQENMMLTRRHSIIKNQVTLALFSSAADAAFTGSC